MVSFGYKHLFHFLSEILWSAKEGKWHQGHVE